MINSSETWFGNDVPGHCSVEIARRIRARLNFGLVRPVLVKPVLVSGNDLINLYENSENKGDCN